jgi:hypothetical protein
MEQKIKQRIQEYSSKYKNDINDWIKKNNIQIKNDQGEPYINNFLEFIYDYPTFELSKQDFQKRTRAKNNIPNYERCCALRLNGERCTRKKKNENFCGTHIKGIPYGSIEDKQNTTNVKIDIWLEEINGIYQYIDENKNVYSTEDINNSIKNPRIICNYNKNEKGEYYIINN